MELVVSENKAPSSQGGRRGKMGVHGLCLRKKQMFQSYSPHPLTWMPKRQEVRGRHSQTGDGTQRESNTAAADLREKGASFGSPLLG